MLGTNSQKIADEVASMTRGVTLKEVVGKKDVLDNGRTHGDRTWRVTILGRHHGEPLASQEAAQARKLVMDHVRQMQVYHKFPIQEDVKGCIKFLEPRV